MTQPLSVPTEIPLAPPPVVQTPEARARAQRIEVRVWSIALLVASLSMLGLGLYMTPSPLGYGTHSRWLHLPPCGFLTITGYPCPTCGCTTAVTWLAHGHLWKSITTQPFGALVGLIAIAVIPLAIVGAWKGKWIGPSPMWVSFHWRSITFFLLAFIALSWLYKAGAMHNWWQA
jgi:hypothetical protein